MKKLTMAETRNIVTRIKKDAEETLKVKIRTEYSSTFIKLKFMKNDNCSYKSVTLDYQELFAKHNKIKATCILTENFIHDYSEGYNMKFYNASSEELFLNSLIEAYECENFYVDTNELHYDGISLDLNDITKMTYYKTIDSIRLDTNLEYCIIELDRDVVTCADKEVAE